MHERVKVSFKAMSRKKIVKVDLRRSFEKMVFNYGACFEPVSLLHKGFVLNLAETQNQLGRVRTRVMLVEERNHIVYASQNLVVFTCLAVDIELLHFESDDLSVLGFAV